MNPQNGCGELPRLRNSRSLRGAGVLCAIAAVLVAGVGLVNVKAGNEPARISIDYPLNGPVFPPTWRRRHFSGAIPQQPPTPGRSTSPSPTAPRPLHLLSKGERMQIGEIDPRCISEHQQAARTDSRTSRRAHLEARRGDMGGDQKAGRRRRGHHLRFTALQPAVPAGLARADCSSASRPTRSARPSSIAMCR